VSENDIMGFCRRGVGWLAILGMPIVASGIDWNVGVFVERSHAYFGEVEQAVGVLRNQSNGGVNLQLLGLDSCGETWTYDDALATLDAVIVGKCKSFEKVFLGLLASKGIPVVSFETIEDESFDELNFIGGTAPWQSYLKEATLELALDLDWKYVGLLDDGRMQTSASFFRRAFATAGVLTEVVQSEADYLKFQEDVNVWIDLSMGDDFLELVTRKEGGSGLVLVVGRKPSIPEARTFMIMKETSQLNVPQSIPEAVRISKEYLRTGEKPALLELEVISLRDGEQEKQIALMRENWTFLEAKERFLDAPAPENFEKLFHKSLVIGIGICGLLLLTACYYRQKSRTLKFGRPSESWKISFADLQLQKILGQGTSARVYKAKWHGKDVAVKVFDEEEMKKVLVTSFVMEVAVLQELRHPNVVLFMGASFEKPNLCIVTELLHYSLHDFIHSLSSESVIFRPKRGSIIFPSSRRNEPASQELRWCDRLGILWDGALGMSYLHEMGVLHHDLKSPNLLLSSHRVCKVADFGMISLKTDKKMHREHIVKRSGELLAGARGRNTSRFFTSKFSLRGRSFGMSLNDDDNDGKYNNSEGCSNKKGSNSDHQGQPRSVRAMKKYDMIAVAAKHGAGTPQWTAPEIIQGEPFSEKADVFSFGIIMSEVINLCDPYPGLSPHEVSIKVADEGLRPELIDIAPKEIVECAKRCMRTDPKQRPTFSELALELEEIWLSWKNSGAPDHLSTKMKSVGNFAQRRRKRPVETYKKSAWFVNKELQIIMKDCIEQESHWTEHEVMFRRDIRRIETNLGNKRVKRRVSMASMFLPGTQTVPKYISPSNEVGSMVFPVRGSRFRGTKEAERIGGTVAVSVTSAVSEASSIFYDGDIEDILETPIEARVKIYEIGTQADRKATFARELDHLHKMSHANLQGILGGWVDVGGNVGIVLETTPSGSLGQLLKSRPEKASSKNCMQILADISRALEFLQARVPPTVHKDIRAANVLLNHQNGGCFAKLSLAGFDFIHKLFRQEDQKLGEPAWSPPEVLLEETYSVESDIYSFGILMWEVLTRELPFSGMDFTSIARKVCIDQKRPEIPAFENQNLFRNRDEFEEFRHVIKRCLIAQPEVRPSVKRLLEFFLEILDKK